MEKTAIAVSLIGTALAIAGCSVAGRPAANDPAVAPVNATRHGADPASAYYALGRYYQGQVRYDQAIRSYRDVLEAQPGHVEAHNALGVIYAAQGRHDLAEEEMRKALSLAPGAAHIHNNLGYDLLLQGRTAEAVAAFREALRLDPGHARAADNLRIALAGQDGGTAAPPPRAAAADSPGERQATPDSGSARQLSAVAPNVFQLRWPAPEARGEAVLPGTVAVSPGNTRVRIELANGNGIGGLARRTSAYLKVLGYGPSRLTNQKPYVQQVTEIQYRPGFERQARILQGALAGKGITAQTSRLRSDVEVRVVLGKDLRSTTRFAASEADPLRLAALADGGD